MSLRHDKKGRSTSRTADSRFAKLDKVPPPFVMLPVELLESGAFRALSGNGKSVLFAIVAAHGRAGPTQNGRLAVSYDAFQNFGLRRSSIRQALDEVETLGFIRRTFRGHRVWGREGGLASEYLLTWRAACLGTELIGPTNEWASFGDDLAAANAAVRQREDKKQRAPQRKYICSPEIDTREIDTEAPVSPSQSTENETHKVAITLPEEKFFRGGAT